MDQMDRVICRKCGGATSMRISRNGFLEKEVLSRLGIYPWKCGACGCTFLFRSRGLRPQRGSSRRSSTESSN